MPRAFNGTTDYVGFAPKAWDTWTGIHIFTVARRTTNSALHCIFYAGPISGGGAGNLALGLDTANDVALSSNGAATASAAPSAANTNQVVGASKADGTATGRGEYSPAPYNTWTHAAMGATLTNPPTTASACEEIGRRDADQDFWNGEIEWVGIWGQGPAILSDNQGEGFHKMAPRFLAGFFHGCQRFWWFNGYVSDTVADRSGHGADEIARSGTTTATTNVNYPGLLGTTFNLIPGVL